MIRKIDEVFEERISKISFQMSEMKGDLCVLEEMEEFITSIAFDRRLPKDIREKAEKIVYVSD